MATAAGLTFTIGQITWTTGSNDFVASTTEGMQIQSASTTSPTPASVTTTLAPASLTPATSLTTRDSIFDHAGYSSNHADNISDHLSHRLPQRTALRQP
jgi:hypothetical protein